MLVLGRKPGEFVVIGKNEVIVRVVMSKDGGLRLAIDAPREMPIWRGEVYEEHFKSECNHSLKVD